jgi:predicted transcriptional regulator
MAISNELSSEIVAAILAENKTPQELGKLKDVVLQVHTTLQQMSEEIRETRTQTKLRRSSQSAKFGST